MSCLYQFTPPRHSVLLFIFSLFLCFLFVGTKPCFGHINEVNLYSLSSFFHLALCFIKFYFPSFCYHASVSCVGQAILIGKWPYCPYSRKTRLCCPNLTKHIRERSDMSGNTYTYFITLRKSPYRDLATRST